MNKSCTNVATGKGLKPKNDTIIREDIAMERFLPVLSTIQLRLRDILTRNEGYMLSWDMSKIDAIGEDLIKLASDVHPALVNVEHRVLSLSLREAGLGIKNRVVEIRHRQLKEEDKEYFRSVHETLGNMCEKIETGEYYQALLRMASRTMRSRKDYIA